MKSRKRTGLLQWLALTASVCTACQAPPLATYPSHVLEEKIRAYTDAAIGRGDKRKVLTLSCETMGDTVTFEMANTFPDSTEASILGYDRISGFTIFFIGSEQKDFIRVNTSPREAKRRLRELILAKYGPGPMPGLNFRTYVFQFVNHQFVH